MNFAGKRQLDLVLRAVDDVRAVRGRRAYAATSSTQSGMRNVHSAAGPRATVLLIELVIPKHDRDFPGKWLDLEMLLNLGARERTAAEYRGLLSRAGFQMTRVVQTASPLSIVEARAA
jgi:O-methyltransferase domain